MKVDNSNVTITDLFKALLYRVTVDASLLGGRFRREKTEEIGRKPGRPFPIDAMSVYTNFAKSLLIIEKLSLLIMWKTLAGRPQTCTKRICFSPHLVIAAN